MTGKDHDADALIAALRAPALPSEGMGEDAAVSAMLEVVTTVPPRSTRHRSRRGVTIAAVTVASLGVGGLVAAGPGVPFFPAADRGPSDGPATTTVERAVLALDDDPIRLPAPVERPVSPAVTTSTLVAGADDVAGVSDDCDEHHGGVVSDVARSSEPDDVVDAARSECGKPDAAGDTPADTAPGRTGDTPADTAPGRTGDIPADTAPGRIGDTPAVTAPGRTGGTPAGTRPDPAPNENPSYIAPTPAAVDPPSDAAPGPSPDADGRP